MRKFSYFVFYSTFFLFLTSCAALTDRFFTDLPDSNKFYRRFPENKKSIAIFKYSSKRSYGSLLWCKVENESDKLEDMDNCNRVRQGSYRGLMMLEPGVYKLVSYSDSDDKYVFNEDIKKTLKRRFIASFELKLGEITYIGSIKKTGSRHKIIDEFEEFGKSLYNKDYEDLQNSFSGHLNNLEWLAGKYESFPELFAKRLAKGKNRPNKKVSEPKAETLVKKISENSKKDEIKSEKVSQEKIHKKTEKITSVNIMIDGSKKPLNLKLNAENLELLKAILEKAERSKNEVKK